jgi:hypothetical protein
VIRRLILVMVASTTFVRPAGSAPARPLGCVDPVVLSKALKGLNDSDWNDISESTLQSKWPLEITGANCIPGACQTLWREDRVINNECECCELFHFDVGRESPDVVTKERLSSIVIHYSATSSGEILAAARAFARALGFSEADAATIRGDAQQHFDREVTLGKQMEIALMTTQVTHQRSIWKLYLLASRHAV